MVNRIRELLEARQFSPTQFADLIGVGRPVISHILSERNKPSLEVVQKVISAFPDVSLAWLMSGTGAMLVSSASAPTPVATSPPVAPAAPIAPPTPSVASSPPTAAPVLPVAPSASVVLLPTDAVPSVFTAFTPGAAASAPVAATQQLPQPPKFRPLAKAAPQPAPATGVPTATPTLSVPAAGLVIAPAAPLAVLDAPAPTIGSPSSVGDGAAPAPLIPATPLAASAELPLPAPAYALSAEDRTAAAPVSLPAVAPSPTGPVAPLASTPSPSNPAAAFSFLGEAGKTIRRIVLFYSDGSFSDYRPEGQ